jgi:hypothetical protein
VRVEQREQQVIVLIEAPLVELTVERGLARAHAERLAQQAARDARSGGAAARP